MVLQNIIEWTAHVYCLGLYTFEKNIKKGKKSDFKEIFFKLAINGQSDKKFLLTSKFFS